MTTIPSVSPSAVAAGQAVYGAEVARRVRSTFAAGQGVSRPFEERSEREREVLDLVAAGHPNAAIAGRMYLSDKTVLNYVTSVFVSSGSAAGPRRPSGPGGRVRGAARRVRGEGSTGRSNRPNTPRERDRPARIEPVGDEAVTATGTGAATGTRGVPDLGAVLRARRGQVVLSARRLRADRTTLPLGHLLATRAGGLLLEEGSWPGSFSVAEGHLVRHRSGPGGEWARQDEDGPVDALRRKAEAAELVLGRPLEPVLVLTGGGATAFAGAAHVRGVTVVPLRHLDAWLDELPETTDQAGLSVLAGRMTRTFPPVEVEARTPSWARGPSPAAAGYRVAPEWRSPAPAWSPSRPPRRPRAGVILTLLLVVGGGLAVAQLGVDRSTDLLTAGWHGATSWVAERTAPPGTQVVPGEVAPDVAVQDPALQDAPVLGDPQSVQVVPEPTTPPVLPPVLLASCDGLAAETVGGILGQPVTRLPGSVPHVCTYGPYPDRPEVVWVSVAVGPGSSEAVVGGVNGGWTHSHGVGTAVTAAPGRVLGTEVAVGVDVGLYPDPVVSGAVADQVVSALAGTG